MQKKFFSLLLSSFLISSSAVMVAQDNCNAAFEQLMQAHSKDISQWKGGTWCSNVQEWLAQKGVRKSVEATEIRQFGTKSVTLEALLYDYTPTGGKPVYMDVYQQGGNMEFIQMPCPTSHSFEKVLPTPAHVLLSYDELYIMKDGKKVQVPNEECWLYPERGLAYFRIINQHKYTPSHIHIFKPCTLQEYFANYSSPAFITPGQSTPRLKK